MKMRFPLRGFGAAFLTLFLSPALLLSAQPAFTNTATLAVSFDGTNVLLRAEFAGTNGAFTLVQGARPDALTLPACSCQISNQIFDIGWVPAARQVQWTLTNWPAASARFFRLQLEPFLTRGRALVFKDGPLDFDAMRRTYGDIANNAQSNGTKYYTNTTPMIFKQPVEVWIDGLGDYDTNGMLTGGNQGRLTSKYAETALNTFDLSDLGLFSVPRLHSANNDFRVNFMGDSNIPPREAVIWSSEVQLFHDVNDYRCRFLNDAFITELQLPPDIDLNVRTLQYRPDLQFTAVPYPNRASKPWLFPKEAQVAGGVNLYPWENSMGVLFRSRATNGSFALYGSQPPLSLCYEGPFMAGEYAGLVAFWIAGTNVDAFTSDAFFGGDARWQSDISPALNDGLNAWVAYRYTGTPEIMRYLSYALRIWGGRPCGGTNIPCDKGQSVRNVMMFDEANTSRDGVFPYTYPSRLGNLDGPVSSDLSSLYLAAIFYDIANEVGLGIHRADLLIWKSISLTTGPPLSMRTYGSKIQEAARQLWPDARPGREGKSRYEEDINDVLTSRGIPLNGVADFRTNLPPTFAVNSPFLERTNNSQRGFGTSTPMLQPGASFYGQFSGSFNGYTFTNTDAHYIAYQFYKHSKVGPADIIGLTDGTFNPTTGFWNGDGTYYIELPDRMAGNLIVLAPGRTIRWAWKGVRARNEAEGFYAEDVRPFGFRVIQATPNGFSFTATALSETPTNKTYQLTIVDPSLISVGPADYAWSFTNHLGAVETSTGTTATYTARKDEPFTIHIARTRAGETNTLTLRERGNDLERSNGNAFVRNLIP